MPIQYDAAIDELYSMVNAAMQSSVDVIGYVPEIRWPGKPEPASVPMDKVWTRVSEKLVLDGIASLASFDGVRRYEAHGLLFIQLFCPRQVANTLSDGRTLAVMLQTAFRSPSLSGAIWFRSARIVQLSATDENYSINVVVEFVFESVQPYLAFEGESMATLTRVVLTSQIALGNHTFILPAAVNVDKMQLFYNGQLQTAPDDFTLVGATITTVLAPKVGDTLTAFV